MTDDDNPVILDHLPDGWRARISTAAANLDITPSALVGRALQAFLDAADRRLPDAQNPHEARV